MYSRVQTVVRNRFCFSTNLCRWDRFQSPWENYFLFLRMTWIQMEVTFASHVYTLCVHLSSWVVSVALHRRQPTAFRSGPVTAQCRDNLSTFCIKRKAQQNLRPPLWMTHVSRPPTIAPRCGGCFQMADYTMIWDGLRARVRLSLTAVLPTTCSV